MADNNNLFEQLFENSDSEEEFEGFEAVDIGNNLPEFDALPVRGDIDHPKDMRLNWSRDFPENYVPPFTANPGIQVDIDREGGPLSFFELFVDNDVYEHISVETNRYYQQVRAHKVPSTFARMHQWYDTNANEMKKFFGISIIMGLVQKAQLREYWTTDWLLKTPAFSDLMPRDRFFNLLTFFHVNNNETAFHRGEDGWDPIHKIRPIYDIFSSRFRNVYTPDECICIDEAMAPWKGRLSFKQYIPNKPDRFGIKLYTMCESKSSYVCDFDVYSGADYEPDQNASAYELNEGHSYHVVMGLLRKSGLLNKGYTLYTDNYYTSPILCDQLFSEDTKCVGTVRAHRKEFPEALKVKLKKDETLFRHRDNLTAMKWADKRDVCMLSTKHGPTMSVTNKLRQDGQPIVKPTCVLDYNKNMGGVDTSDQLNKYYSFNRKTLKWWIKLFFFMFNMVITNAYVLYRKYTTHRPPLSQHDFRKELARTLVSYHQTQKPKRGRSNTDNLSRLTDRHFIDVIPAKAGAKKKSVTGKCVVCNVNSGKRRAPGEPSKRTETRYWCPDCQKPLCIGLCFRRYHTLKHYKLRNGDTTDSNSDSDSDSD